MTLIQPADPGARDPALAPPVTFKLASAPHITRVEIAGDFTGWTPVAMPAADGWYQLAMRLDPGTYRYKFRINGRDWVEDPLARLRTLEDGAQDSVVVVKRRGGPPAPLATCLDELEQEAAAFEGRAVVTLVLSITAAVLLCLLGHAQLGRIDELAPVRGNVMYKGVDVEKLTVAHEQEAESRRKLRADIADWEACIATDAQDLGQEEMLARLQRMRGIAAELSILPATFGTYVNALQRSVRSTDHAEQAQVLPQYRQVLDILHAAVDAHVLRDGQRTAELHDRARDWAEVFTTGDGSAPRTRATTADAGDEPAVDAAGATPKDRPSPAPSAGPGARAMPEPGAARTQEVLTLSYGDSSLTVPGFMARSMFLFAALCLVGLAIALAGLRLSAYFWSSASRLRAEARTTRIFLGHFESLSDAGKMAWMARWLAIVSEKKPDGAPDTGPGAFDIVSRVAGLLGKKGGL